MITSLTKIEESTDALSKGLLGFMMNINEYIPEETRYIYPPKATAWITVTTTNPKTTTKDSGLPVKYGDDTGRKNWGKKPVFDWCWADENNQSGHWCKSAENGPWNGTNGNTDDQYKRFSCGAQSWGDNDGKARRCPCGDSCPSDVNPRPNNENCIKCQYIDAINCQTSSLTTGGDKPNCRGGSLVGCMPCQASSNPNSYAIGYSIKNGPLQMYNGGTTTAYPTCGLETQTIQYWGELPLSNWMIGKCFYGTRTGNGKPVSGTDYLIAICNKRYVSALGCGGGYCDDGAHWDQMEFEGTDLPHPKGGTVKDGTVISYSSINKKGGWIPQFSELTVKGPSPGWLRGEWTFPITTQSTQPITGSQCSDNNECTSGQFCNNTVCNKQDTLGYVASQGPGKCVTSDAMIGNTKRGQSIVVSKPPPAINLHNFAGIAPWLSSFLTNCEDPKAGFLRDYVIIRTFAAAYCATLYGHADVSANECRKHWLEDGGSLTTTFQPIWNAEGLLGGTNVFGEQLYDQLKDSFHDDEKTNQIPFFTELGELTQKPGEVFTSSSTAKRTGLSITLPVDGFRMQSIINKSNDIPFFSPGLFQKEILTPLIGSGCITNYLPNKSAKTAESPCQIGTKLTVCYQGIGYKAENPFAKTMQTSPEDYVMYEQNRTTRLPVTWEDYKNNPQKCIDFDILWPQYTHAWIQKGGVVDTAGGSQSGNQQGMIEALYYVTVDIEKWNPALALLYLSTIPTDAPLGVLKQIQTDTGLVPINLLKQICKEGNCVETIKGNCERAYSNPDTSIPPKDYFLLYNASTRSLCSCINSGLVPGSISNLNDQAAQCFDQTCGSYVPGTTKTLSELLGLTDNVCTADCDTIQSYLDGMPRNLNALNPEKFNRLCGGNSFNSSNFNLIFFIYLLVPTVILTATILLLGGINTPTIVIASLALLTLTGGAYYLARIFTPFTQCGDISIDGVIPMCVSKYNRQMEIHPSFCNLNMFCECIVDQNCGGDDCTCKGGVCLSKTPGSVRNSYEKPVKMINLPMVILSSALIILVPILIFGLRKRLFPKIPNIMFMSIIFLSVSIFGTILVLSLFSYSNPRVEYVKQSCGPAPEPSSGPSLGSVESVDECPQ